MDSKPSLGLDVTPAFVPVPSFDAHDVASCEYDGCGEVDSIEVGSLRASEGNEGSSTMEER